MVYLQLHLFGCFHQFLLLRLQEHNGTEELHGFIKIHYNGSLSSDYSSGMTLTHYPIEWMIEGRHTLGE